MPQRRTIASRDFRLGIMEKFYQPAAALGEESTLALILHITARSQWEQARRDGEFRADSLATEGFLHAATPEQVAWVARTFFQGQSDLVLLQIDTDRVCAPIRWESPPDSEERFPHIYGPLNLDAIVDVAPFEPAGARGHFLDELRTSFAQHAARPALIYRGQSFTFGALDRLAQRCAAWLRRLGVERGDRVAVITAEKWLFLIAHLGVLDAGAVSLPLNPRCTTDELRFFLEDSGAKVAIVSAERCAIVEDLRSSLPELCSVQADRAVGDLPEDRARMEAKAEDPCLILYSSGTTGRPKGVIHTHANLASSLHGLREGWRYAPDDVTVNLLPLFHIHGLSFATHLSWLAGACMIMEDAFHPRQSLETVGKGTVFMAIPTFYYTFLDRPEFREAVKGWGHVRLFTCGSAPIRPDVLAELESILGRPVINRYGMTEGHVITSLPLDGPWPRGSVGLPLQGIEVRVARGDGMEAPAEAVGSVQLRGPNLFRGYWRNPEATRAAFAAGWFDTGDLGQKDVNGFLTLVGRKHDLIITSGFNVYPQVVERVLNTCPGVRESAIVGVPDLLRGERVVAVIIRDDPALDEKRLRAYCSEHLVDYQRPVIYHFLDALPRNALGKVLRRELRDRLAGTEGVL
jgi:malonyl-CoA/methylmalonyl-CoA synthetase